MERSNFIPLPQKFIISDDPIDLTGTIFARPDVEEFEKRRDAYMDAIYWCADLKCDDADEIRRRQEHFDTLYENAKQAHEEIPEEIRKDVFLREPLQYGSPAFLEIAGFKCFEKALREAKGEKLSGSLKTDLDKCVRRNAPETVYWANHSRMRDLCRVQPVEEVD